MRAPGHPKQKIRRYGEPDDIGADDEIDTIQQRKRR